MSSRTRLQVVRQSLHLRISPSSYTASDFLIASKTPPSAAATMGSRYLDSYYSSPTSAQPSQMFSVLCLYSFSSSEESMLSFERYEVLDIIKRHETGWWAAMLDDGVTVGWIPSAFVAPLSDEMAARLRQIEPSRRLAEYEAEQLYLSAPVSRMSNIFDDESTASSPFDTEDEILMMKKTSSPSSPSNLFKEFTSYSRKRGQPTIEKTKESSKEQPQLSPSPRSPMPYPGGFVQPKSLKHSASSPDVKFKGTKPASIARNASARPRPVIVDDNSTLNRLSTLIESTSKKDIKRLIIPDLSGSFDGLSLRGRDTKGPKRKDSGSAPSATQSSATSAPQLLNTIIDIKPSYLQPQFAHEIDEDGKGHIRTASLPALIERLTTDMPYANLSKLAEISTFTNVFLMTFRTFTTAAQLFDSLVDRFKMRPPKPLEGAEYQDWTLQVAIPTQRRVLDVFSIWLTDHRLLEEEPFIAQNLSQFLRNITSPPHDNAARQIIKLIERLTFAVPQQPLSASTPKKGKKPKPHKNDLLRLDPHDLAEQLTLYEFGLYSKMTAQECLAYAKTQSGDTVARLLEFCSTHDKLGSWVKSSILNLDVLGRRSDTVDFWIKVAEKCRSLHNIDSMSSIIIALSSTVITRLHLTWAHVSRRSILDSMLRYNDPTGSFGAYRRLMQAAEGPCVPFISMYLTDIVHVKAQFSGADGDDKICFYQRARWYEIITNILKHQSRPYNIAVIEQTAKFVEDHLKENAGRDQNWFWSKSQEVQHTEVANADIRKGLEEAGF